MSALTMSLLRIKPEVYDQQKLIDDVVSSVFDFEEEDLLRKSPSPDYTNEELLEALCVPILNSSDLINDIPRFTPSSFSSSLSCTPIMLHSFTPSSFTSLKEMELPDAETSPKPSEFPSSLSISSLLEHASDDTPNKRGKTKFGRAAPRKGMTAVAQ